VDFLLKGYEKAKRAGEKCGLDVFFGWEFSYGESDFLTYGLDRDFLLKHPEILDMSIEEYSALVRSSGGYLAQAHPFRKSSGPVDPSLVDGIEVYNGGSTSADGNKKAMEFAELNQKPMQAGSDSHFIKMKHIGGGRLKKLTYSGVRLEQRAENIFDIIAAIKNGTARPILPPIEKETSSFPDVGDAVPVRIFYDCQHAQDMAEGLCDYIRTHFDMDAQYAKIDMIDKIGGEKVKIVVIGHHSETDDRLDKLKELRYNRLGMEYGFDRNICVLRASESVLKKSERDKSKFDAEYCRKFEETPDNEHTRAAQFKFLMSEFMENGLEKFLIYPII
jgi:hypothetical protein